MALERSFQDELKRGLESVIGRFKFGGLEFSRVERDYPLMDTRQPDIVIFLKPGETPFLIIETKRKIERHGRTRGYSSPSARPP